MLYSDFFSARLLLLLSASRRIHGPSAGDGRLRRDSAGFQDLRRLSTGANAVGNYALVTGVSHQRCVELAVLLVLPVY